ncbi:hypothetical protein FJW07_31410 [Mesorhizobium sp. B3-1-9]|nr:hypothetical protein FJW07_31410 [Mesorhizobium sp. B3-1-9]
MPALLPRSGTLGLSNGSDPSAFSEDRAMAVLAFDFVYFCQLTGADLLGGIVCLLAFLMLYNVMAEDRPNR